MTHAEGIERALDAMSRERYGWTYSSARRLGCCVSCRRDVDLSSLSDLDRMEWHLSALCPACYTEATRDCEE